MTGAGSVAMAQDGSFFTDDVFIEEDVMIEGTFESGFVTETYEESIEEDGETDSANQEDTQPDD
ncbi:MAG: hypothetical protein ACFB0Z_05135 [Candidatus Phaeomarinobacter sp.]